MAQPTESASQRVLVIDDDDDTRETLRLLLEDASYDVVVAPDGASALQRLRESERRMVVLVDLRMPGVDGVQVLRAVEAEEPLATRHSYILFTVDIRPQPAEVHDLLERLHAPTLLKPFNIDRLLEMVREAEQRLH